LANCRLDPDPVFAAIEKYEAACKTFNAAMGRGGIERDVIDAADAALRELVFLTPTTAAGEAAQREFFTSHTRRWENGLESVWSVCTLPHVRCALTPADASA
jgi:hypothetical protein